VTDVVTYASITAVLLTAVFLPTVVYDWYSRSLNTLLLGGVVGLAGRSVLARVLAFRQPSTPKLDCDDADVPPVSVVVPAFNEEPVLPDTIAACRAVDYPAEKLASVHTLSYAILPTSLVITVPLTPLALTPGFPTETYVPHSQAIWTLLAAAPPLARGMVFLQDFPDGHSHQRREYLAGITLWFYLVAQTVVFVTAFIQEFVLDEESVYVTTSRSEVPANDWLGEAQRRQK